MTPARRVERAGDFPFDRVIPGTAHIEARNLRQQGLGIGVVGRAKQLLHRRALDHTAQIHDHHAVTQMLDHAQVMADEQIRQAQFVSQVHEQIEDLRLNRHIERRHRFIAHQQLRLHCQRAGDADTLALAPTELMRVALPQAGVEPRALQLGTHVIIKAGAVGQALQARTLTHDAIHTQARIEAG